MTTSASVTIPYNEFEALQKARREAEQKAAALEKQIRDTKIEASDQSVLALANAALEVVRYAVGSLPPESNRNWPFEALRKVAALLPLMPDARQDHNEFSRTLEVFALECERYEQRRRALGINPQTLMPEAPR